MAGHAAAKRGRVNRPEEPGVDHPEPSRRRRVGRRGRVRGKSSRSADREVGDWRRLDDHNRRLDNFIRRRSVGSLSLRI